MHYFHEISTDFHKICIFLWKKKPLREAPQRIKDFYTSKKSRNVIFPEKKAPAGGPTTDMGFLSKIPKNTKF